MSTMEPTIKFIGKIHSELKRIEECPLQENENAPEATIEILPEFMEGIQDITVGSEILLLTWLHMADRSVIKCYPRNNRESRILEYSRQDLLIALIPSVFILQKFFPSQIMD